MWLRQPVVSSVVALAVAAALTIVAPDTEVELLDVLVLAQVFSLTIHHYPAVFENIAVRCKSQCDVGVLLSEKEANAFLGIDVVNDLENMLDDLRRKAHRRLIQQDHVRLRHQRATDGAHLLLPSRGIARLTVAPFAQSRKIIVDHFKRSCRSGAPVLTGEGSGKQIFLDRQMTEAVTAFHHLYAAAPDQIVGRQAIDPLTVQLDRAFGDCATFGSY